MTRRSTSETAHVSRVSSLLTHGPGPLQPARLVRLTEALTDAGAECGLLVVRDDRPPRSLAASGGWAALVEAIQVEERTGPSIEAAMSLTTVRVSDLSRERRWSAFAERAVREYDAHGVLSIPLPVGGSDRAALTFYSREPCDFHDLDDLVLAVVGPVAGLSVEATLRHQDSAHLQAALGSNRRIGAAVGILMADERLSDEEAFARLVGTSQCLNRKLRDVAGELVETRRLPGPEGVRP